jgi:hypothetical protein
MTRSAYLAAARGWLGQHGSVLLVDRTPVRTPPVLGNVLHGIGVRALRCRVRPADQCQPYAVLARLLSGVRHDDPAAQQLPRAQQRVLVLAVHGGHGTTAAAVGRAALCLLRALATAGPVVVAVDDVQWLDVHTAEVLRFVAARAGGTPIRVVASEHVHPGIEPVGHLLCPPPLLIVGLPAEASPNGRAPATSEVAWG